MAFQTPPPKEKPSGGLLGRAALMSPEGTPDTPVRWGEWTSSAIEASLPTLSVMTWNVWFDKFRQAARYSEMFRMVIELQPDFVCFQEATATFAHMLVESGLLEHYDCSDNGHGGTVCPYGVVSLARKHLHARFAFVEVPSRMHRKLLLTHVTLTGGQRLAVGNIHLESLANRKMREAQLRICSEALSHFEHSLLCGDFNFCSYRNYDGSQDLENQNIEKLLPTMNDLWPTLYGAQEPCYTFDGNTNRLVTDENERMRYDRICFRFFEDRFRPQYMEVLNKPVRFVGQDSCHSENGFVVVETMAGKYFLFPSDHFGLFGLFTSGPTTSGGLK